MKRYLFHGALASWIAASTILLVRFWYARPEKFPSMLKTAGNAIIDFIGTHTPERAADVELAYVVLAALLIIGALTGIAFVCWQGIRAITRHQRNP